MSRIVIAEDHTIVREGLRALLGAQPNLEVCGEAADGREAIRRVMELSPDLVLLDLNMPGLGGLDAVREISRCCPGTKVLILTVDKSEELVHACLRAGAAGYVLKDASSVELVLAIRSVLEGKTYLSPEISGQVVAGYLRGGAAEKPTSAWEVLSDRERQVLKLIAEGRRNKEIADYLCISVKTVEKHRESLMRKLDLHTASALTGYALRRGLASP